MCFATSRPAGDWQHCIWLTFSRCWKNKEVCTNTSSTHTQPPLSSGVLPEAQSILITQPWACVCTLSLPLIPCVLPGVCTSCPVLSPKRRNQGPQPNDSIQPCRHNSILSTQMKYGFFFSYIGQHPNSEESWIEIYFISPPQHSTERVKQEV